MIRFLRNHIIFILLLLFSACATQTEDEVYQNAMKIDTAKERIAALEDFFKNFPDSDKKDKILFRIFRDFVALGNEKEAVSSAARFVAFFPKGYRMSQYNSVAWILAENKMGLDSAKVYADRAVEQAKEAGTKTLNMIKDTQAYVYYQSGDAAKALSIQAEALQGNENSADYLSRYALYQHDAGYLKESLETIARTILYGGGLESRKNFTQWLETGITDNEARKNLAKRVVNKVVAEYLKKDVTIDKKSQCAVLMALAGIDLKKSEKWISEAFASIDENTSFEQQLAIHQNMATVYNAMGKYKNALESLQPVEELASIYDTGFWFDLGNAFAANDLKGKAIDAYINGMLWRRQNDLLGAATQLGWSESEINDKIKKRKQELLNFNPGHFGEICTFTGKVVLAELFTGAECGPCKGADLAFDLIAEYYPRSMVAILEYHLHIPGPDPLTNPDTEKRYEYYGKNLGTPTVFFNGQGKITGGGSDLVKKDLFTKYKKSIEKYFDKTPEINLTISAGLTDGTIEINTEIENKGNKNINANLHIAIVEKSINYSGSNGIDRYAFVVRFLANDADGEVVHLNNSNAKITKHINLNEIEKRQEEYLTGFAKDPPRRFRNFSGWNETKETLDHTNLAVVAWLQDNKTRQVLQAIYSDLQK